MIDCLDWVVTTFLPAFFIKFNTWEIAPGVSILGFCVAIVLICIVVGAVVLRV